VRDLRLSRTALQLRYKTTPEQLRYVLARLRELLAHPKVLPDPACPRQLCRYACLRNDFVIARKPVGFVNTQAVTESAGVE
jgi:MscS family membrane protein